MHKSSEISGVELGNCWRIGVTFIIYIYFSKQKILAPQIRKFGTMLAYSKAVFGVPPA